MTYTEDCYYPSTGIQRVYSTYFARDGWRVDLVVFGTLSSTFNPNRIESDTAISSPLLSSHPFPLHTPKSNSSSTITNPQESTQTIKTGILISSERHLSDAHASQPKGDQLLYHYFFPVPLITSTVHYLLSSLPRTT